MTLSPDEAARALKDIDQTQTRAMAFRSYQFASIYFFLWGGMWLIANGLNDLFPTKAGIIWLVADVLGVLGTIVTGRRQRNRHNWRYMATAGAATVFVVATFAILRPKSGQQVEAFIALVVALLYMVQGLWIGVRIFMVGIVLLALIIVGYFVFFAHFFLWMAVVGGGTLILTGLWLRRA